jgi:HAD superfamily hydrolase (TIGR01509 family)
MLRALIFDFDGLIVDTETALIDSYAAVHAAHGLAFNRNRFIHAVGHADYAFDAWSAFGRLAPRATLEQERHAIAAELRRRQPVLPGVTALIAAARARSFHIGLASNSDHAWVESHLEERGLRAEFDFIACREDVPSPKPEPDLYRHVLQRFGLRGSEAVAFEDSHTGTLAAKRANLFVVSVPNASTAHHDFSITDLRVNSLDEITLDALIARFVPAR